MDYKKTIWVLFIFPFAVMGQTRDVSGTVVDDNNMPLPGANVVAKGKKIGTSTDFDGKFKLTIPNSVNTLEVSYLGFLTEDVPIGKQSKITVQLKSDAQSLDEIVVVGYGSLRKSDVTGAIASIKVDETAAQENNTVDQLLQGRAAGVRVIQNNGTPGSGVSVRIRGTNSLRGNNEPLYVVDGVIISSAGEDAANADSNSNQVIQNGLNGINPRDIQSIEVLKDASATAIYGSRGANGVVLITTKTGKSGKTNISGYISTNVAKINKEIKVLDAVDYAKYRNENTEINGGDTPYLIQNGQIYPINYDGDGTPIISETPAQQINWQDEIYRPGFSTSIGTSFSGGNENGNFYLSAGYNDLEGVVNTYSLKSGDINLKLNQRLSDHLKVDARISGYYGDGSFSQDGDKTGGPRSFVTNILNYRPIISNDDDDIDNDLGISNPYTWINDYQDVTKENRYIGSIALTYNFDIKGLEYKLQVGGDIRDKERKRFYGLTTFQGSTTNGSLSISELKANSYQVNNLLTYEHAFNKIHRVNLLAGITYDVKNTTNSIYEVQDFSTTQFGVEQPIYGQTITKPLNTLVLKSQLLSYLFRANYSYDSRYIFTGTLRADGSSKFKDENKYGYFPSFSLAWRLNQEKFLTDSKILNELKIRAGWGITGNQGIAPYQTFANYGTVLYATPSNGTSNAFVPLNIGNRSLKWESTKQANLGLDFGFLNNRISGTFDVYNKMTDNLLQQQALPASSGFPTFLINRGSINNKGMELTLNLSLVEKTDFTIKFGSNIAFNKSQIGNLGIPSSDIYINGTLQQRSFYFGDQISKSPYFKAPANIFMEGEEIGMFIGYETNGIYQENDDFSIADTQPGDIRIIDQNGDNEIDAMDRTIIGNPNPDFTYGGYANVAYKGLSLDVLFTGVSGNEIANGLLPRMDTPEGSSTNINRNAYEQAWRLNSPSTTYPRIGYKKELQSLAITDRIIEDGSYFNLSNITLGYDIPMNKDQVLKRMNVYISVNNLLILTKYNGYNPEVTTFMGNGNILGVDWGGYPNTRSFSLGLNVNF